MTEKNMALFGSKTSTSTKATADKEDKQEERKDKISAASSSVKVPAVLLSPRISEKSSHLATQNKYVFNVKKEANKVEIKKAVESVYKVKVVQVNILNTEGKKRNYGRTSGKMSDFKKAVVTLKKGDSIEVAQPI